MHCGNTWFRRLILLRRTHSIAAIRLVATAEGSAAWGSSMTACGLRMRQPGEPCAGSRFSAPFAITAGDGSSLLRLTEPIMISYTEDRTRPEGFLAK
jgi:hypothetical protein